MIQRDVLITLDGGVHALVAQQLAGVSDNFASSVFLRHQGTAASTHQPISVLALRLNNRTVVTVLADGPDEIAALDAISRALQADPPRASGTSTSAS